MKTIFITVLTIFSLVFNQPALAEYTKPRQNVSYYYSDYIKNQELYEHLAQSNWQNSRFKIENFTGNSPAYLNWAFNYHAPIEDRGYLNWLFLSLAVGSVAYILITRD